MRKRLSKIFWWRWAGVCLLTCASLLLIGFGLFLRSALRTPNLPPFSDGIVALTGGTGRVETSLSLLEQGRGRLLLVSGVDPKVTLQELAPNLPAALTGRITLGREATSTAGNATETKHWVRANRLHSLIIVTAGYHMWRAELEIARTLPDVQLNPYPVQPPAMKRPFTRGTWHLLVREYGKFLLTCIGPVKAFRHTVDAT
ncbi:MAG: YdcF family protein [Acetobacter aceti]|nr:YdcF family protein [Acetobacter aceti]